MDLQPELPTDITTINNYGTSTLDRTVIQHTRFSWLGRQKTLALFDVSLINVCLKRTKKYIYRCSSI